jgi:hypothetical protein
MDVDLNVSSKGGDFDASFDVEEGIYDDYERIYDVSC